MFTLTIKYTVAFNSWAVIGHIPFTLHYSTAINAHFGGGGTHEYSFALANMLTTGDLQIGTPIASGETLTLYGSGVYSTYESDKLI